MCFSATASFTASFTLLLCGIASLYRAKKNQHLFAMIPIFFSIQQFIEGTIWQSLTSGASAQLATYAYLSLVFIIWPNWIPLSIAVMSKRISEKKALVLPMVAGICTSILAIASFFASSPTARIIGNHIQYTAHLPVWTFISGTFLYLIAAITPFFIPHIPNLWLMGVIAAISYTVSFIFYRAVLLSVWCFFTALLSVLVFIIIGKKL